MRDVQALARRLETIAASDLRLLAFAAQRAFPAIQPEVLEVAGGVAAFVGPASPVNQTVGLGFSGDRVSQCDVEAVEEFFRARGARPIVSVCSLADGSLEDALMCRGWTPLGCEDVMVREISSADEIPGPEAHVEIRLAETPEEREVWALVSANGFSAPDDPTPAELQLCRSIVARDDGWFLLALVDGRPAGTAELQCHDGVGWLSADSTVPQFRGRGVQRSLQRARLTIARDAGCELAVSEAAAESSSKRNMERLGLCHAYSRTEWAAPIGSVG
ncbi:MAG: hypothetical protein HGA39_02840 [Coriobacteriia bacterium]|nr:hypothetical protein [Coriobacteriia bacterium]